MRLTNDLLDHAKCAQTALVDAVLPHLGDRREARLVGWLFERWTPVEERAELGALLARATDANVDLEAVNRRLRQRACRLVQAHPDDVQPARRGALLAALTLRRNDR